MTFAREKRLWLGALSLLAPLPLPLNDAAAWTAVALFGLAVAVQLRRAWLGRESWLPNWALNATTAQLFNTAYYWKHMEHKGAGLIAPDAFFYPLDAILHWNRAYGPRGFSQYQCVLPRARGPEAVRDFMHLLTKLGGASPLCVIKDCGPEGKGVLSFPLEGTSIAVDMAVSPDIQGIVDRLNEFVIEAGGRIYLTKDRFTRPEHFAKMEPRLPKFTALRDKWDPTRRLRSAQSVRILGDAG